MYRAFELEFRTEKEELKDITDKVEQAVREGELDDGICLVYSPHTTAGIIVNENEPGLKKDILESLEKVFPEGDGYRHNSGAESNATSHLRNILTGTGQTVPFENGELELGTWQKVFLVETDGPRRRTVKVCLLG